VKTTGSPKAQVDVAVREIGRDYAMHVLVEAFTNGTPADLEASTIRANFALAGLASARYRLLREDPLRYLCRD
jgi:hypothetical protein